MRSCDEVNLIKNWFILLVQSIIMGTHTLSALSVALNVCLYVRRMYQSLRKSMSEIKSKGSTTVPNEKGLVS